MKWVALAMINLAIIAVSFYMMINFSTWWVLLILFGLFSLQTSHNDEKGVK
jgi:hypothetical protein